MPRTMFLFYFFGYGTATPLCDPAALCAEFPQQTKIPDNPALARLSSKSAIVAQSILEPSQNCLTVSWHEAALLGAYQSAADDFNLFLFGAGLAYQVIYHIAFAGELLVASDLGF